MATQQTKSVVVLIAAAMAATALVLDTLTWLKMRHSIEAVGHSMQIITEWERIFSQLKDAESSQRGFLLTGSENYLESLNVAETLLPDSFQLLENLDSGERSLIKDIKEIRQLVRTRLEYITETVLIRRRMGIDAAIEIVKSNKGKRVIDDIRLKITKLIEHQQAVIDERTAVMKKDLSLGYLSATATGVIALIAGCLAWYFLRESLLQARREHRLGLEKRRAEDAGREKSFFLAAMSHEIRTPMNAILGFSELLGEEEVTQKQRRYIQSIYTGARSLLRLINDILDISKIEAGMMQVNVEPTDVREIGRFLLQLFNQQAASKDTALSLEVEDSMPHSLLLDSVRLRQILINVVGNALKFTQHGQVIIRFKSEMLVGIHNRLNLHIEVEDSGVGIPADQLCTVFKPFVQGENNQPGTGLGLTIVRRLVDLMGGTVKLNSEVGRGSTFQFVFPDIVVSARLPLSNNKDEQPVNFDDLRPSLILVADDNETNRDLVQGIFSNTGHRLHLVANGAGAVQAVQTERPDIVLMDIRMPDMDGREALDMIRRQPDFTLLPIIAITASSLTSDERELRRLFDGFVRKPFSRAELYREIAQFISRRDSTDDRPSPVANKNETLSPAIAAKWRDFSELLLELERDRWQKVRDSMVMSEVKNFAIDLRDTARRAQCPGIEKYASELAADAEIFALSSLERRLAEFPERIADIERRSSSL